MVVCFEHLRKSIYTETGQGEGHLVKPRRPLLPREEGEAPGAGGKGRRIASVCGTARERKRRASQEWQWKRSLIHLLVDARVVDPQVELARLAPHPLRQLLNRVANLDRCEIPGRKPIEVDEEALSRAHYDAY